MSTADMIPEKERYLLRLYIAGPTLQGTRAVVNIRTICEEYLNGRYDLEIFDLLDDPNLAQQDQIIAAPTLAKIYPLPAKRFIGDLSQTEQILKGLGLRTIGAAEEKLTS